MSILVFFIFINSYCLSKILFLFFIYRPHPCFLSSMQHEELRMVEEEASWEYKRAAEKLREIDGYNHLADKPFDYLKDKLNFLRRESNRIIDELLRRLFVNDSN